MIRRFIARVKFALRPMPRFEEGERTALVAAISFLSKPLSELKQYASDGQLMGSNSMAALRSLERKLAREWYDERGNYRFRA